MHQMRFTVLSCMNGIERLWIGTSDAEVFEIGYNTMMKLAEEKLLGKGRTVKFQVKACPGRARTNGATRMTNRGQSGSRNFSGKRS